MALGLAPAGGENASSAPPEMPGEHAVAAAFAQGQNTLLDAAGADLLADFGFDVAGPEKTPAIPAPAPA